MSDKMITVKVPEELLKAADKLIETAQDRYHTKLFHSRSQVATEALRDFLDKHNKIPVEVAASH